jgi:hypothetical protein
MLKIVMLTMGFRFSSAFVAPRASLLSAQSVMRFGSTVSPSLQAPYRGPMQEKVESLLKSSFSPFHLEVFNESHGRKEDESHFKV